MKLVEGGLKVNLRRVISNGGDPANVQQKKSTICSPKMITQDMWSENPGLTLLSSTSTGIKAVIMGFRLVRITVWICWVISCFWYMDVIKMKYGCCWIGITASWKLSSRSTDITSSKLSSRTNTSEFKTVIKEEYKWVRLAGIRAWVRGVQWSSPNHCQAESLLLWDPTFLQHRLAITSTMITTSGRGLLSPPPLSPPALPPWSPEAQVLLSLRLCLPLLLHSYCLLEGDSSKKATRKSKKLLKVAHMA